MGTILVVHDELNSLELPVFKKDDRSKPELRYFPMNALESVLVYQSSLGKASLEMKRILLQIK